VKIQTDLKFGEGVVLKPCHFFVSSHMTGTIVSLKDSAPQFLNGDVIADSFLNPENQGCRESKWQMGYPDVADLS